MTRAASPIAALLLLGACGWGGESDPVVATSVPSVPPERVDAFVVLMEKLGCRFDPNDHEPVHTAGFTDEEIASIGAVLVADHRADLTDTGELVILSGNCL